MHHLLNVFLEILRLRKGPQVLPASGLLLGIVLGLHFACGLGYNLLYFPLFHALGIALVATAAVPALVQVILTLRGLPHRFMQTATAVAGCELLLDLPILPLAAWQPKGELTLAAALLLAGWGIVVAAHIFRHALEVSAWKGFAVAVVYFSISVLVMAGLFAGSGV